MQQRLALSCLALVVSACGAPNEDRVTVEAQRSLKVMLGGAQVLPVGVTADPQTGEQFVLDNTQGLLRLGESVEVLATPQQLLLEGERAAEFTDVVSLGDGRFAMTVVNDGYLLDLKAKTFEQFFCYEPGWIPDVFPAPAVAEQITNSLTYDAVAGVMYAQPQTFVTEDGVRRLELSQVGEFDAQNGGEGYGWIDIDTDINAGGLAVEANDSLLLGVGSMLHRLDMLNGGMTEVVDLAEFGIQRIDGITTLDDGRLVILDGAQSELFTVALRR